jgi:hypothetical protein
MIARTTSACVAAIAMLTLFPAPVQAQDNTSYFNGFEEGSWSDWTLYGSAGYNFDQGTQHSGFNNGWVTAVGGERTWNAITLPLPQQLSSAVCQAQVWIATSEQLSYGELDVRNADGADLAHVGPFGMWAPAPGNNGYNTVTLSFVAQGPQPLYFIAGLWGDGSYNEQWVRVDDFSVICTSDE